MLEPVADSFQADGLRARIRLSAGRSSARDALAALDAGETSAPSSCCWRQLPDDDVRQLIVGELDRRGPADPLARETRRRLAAALY